MHKSCLYKVVYTIQLSIYRDACDQYLFTSCIRRFVFCILCLTWWMRIRCGIQEQYAYTSFVCLHIVLTFPQLQPPSVLYNFPCFLFLNSPHTVSMRFDLLFQLALVLGAPCFRESRPIACCYQVALLAPGECVPQSPSGSYGDQHLYRYEVRTVEICRSQRRLRSPSPNER